MLRLFGHLVKKDLLVIVRSLDSVKLGTRLFNRHGSGICIMFNGATSARDSLSFFRLF